MDDANARDDADTKAPETESQELEGHTIDPGKLAEGIAGARARLRESRPECFVDRADECAAILEVDEQLGAVERALRGEPGTAEGLDGSEGGADGDSIGEDE